MVCKIHSSFWDRPHPHQTLNTPDKYKETANPTLPSPTPVRDSCEVFTRRRLRRLNGKIKWYNWLLLMETVCTDWIPQQSEAEQDTHFGSLLRQCVWWSPSSITLTLTLTLIILLDSPSGQMAALGSGRVLSYVYGISTVHSQSDLPALNSPKSIKVFSEKSHDF